MNSAAEQIDRLMRGFAERAAFPGAAVIIDKGGREVFRGAWGHADPVHEVPFRTDTMVRLASMTKPVTAIAVMQLAERGLLDIDDPVSRFLPGYASMYVLGKYVRPNGTYVPDARFPKDMPVAELEKAAFDTAVPAERQITIRDILSHSSGIGQGRIGGTLAMRWAKRDDDLAARVERWQDLPLDFQPGTDTGYSAFVGFDILARIVEICSGMDYEAYLNRFVFEPLGIRDVCFRMNAEQRDRVCERYFVENGKLYTGSDIQTARDVESLDLEICSVGRDYFSGAAGLWGSAEAYHRIVKMLAGKGTLEGVRVLEEGSVLRMRMQGPDRYMEPHYIGERGCVWGLGMIIDIDATLKGTLATPGTYGWNGAYGTRMFVEPESGLCMTLTTSITNCCGNLSPSALALQKRVFELYA